MPLDQLAGIFDKGASRCLLPFEHLQCRGITRPTEHTTPLHDGCDGIAIRALQYSGHCAVVAFVELRVGSDKLFGVDVNVRRVLNGDETAPHLPRLHSDQ